MAKGFSVFVDIGGRINGSLPAAIKGAESQVAALGRRVRGINASVSTAVSNAGRGVSAAGKRLQDTGRNVTTAVSAPLGLLGLGAGKMAFEFEKAGNMLEALGDATEAQRADFERFANDLNKKYPQSLAGIITTGNEMLKGGFNFDQMKGSIDQTLATAVLGEMTPAEVGNMMARTINSFQLPMKTYAESMRSSQRVSDQMTFAAVKTTASLKDMGEMYRYVGGASSAAGISLEQASAFAMAFAKNGSVGSDAGVAMRSAIVRMVKMPPKALAAMERVGMKLGDYVGKGARKVTSGSIISGLQADGIDATPVKRQIDKALNDKALAGSPVKLSAAITKIIQSGVAGAGKDAVDSKVLAENVQSSIVAAGSKIDLMKFFTDLKSKMDKGEVTLGDVATILEGRHASRYMALLQSDLPALLKQIETESDGYTQSRYGTVLKGIVGPVYEVSAAIEKLSVALGRATFPTLAVGLSAVADGIQSFSEKSPALMRIVGALGLAAIALGPFLMAAGATLRVVGMLARGLGLLATAATFGLASKLVMISAAIRGFAAAQVAVAVASIMRLRTALVGLMLLGAVGGRGAVFGALALGARALIPALLALLNPVKLVTSALKLLRFALLGTGVGAILLGIGAAGAFIYKNWNGLGKAFTTFKAGFMAALGPEAQSALKPVTSLLTAIGKAWDDLTGKKPDGTLMMWGFSLGRSLGTAARSLRELAPLFNIVGGAWIKLRDYFASGSGNLFANTAREIETIKGVFTGLVDVFETVRAKIAEVPAAFEMLKTKAQEGYNAVLAINWGGLGSAIIDAIVSGVSGAAGRLVDAVKGAAQRAWEGAKGAIGLGGGGGGGAAPRAAAPSGPAVAGARALGGPVRGGLPYLVGERGPEIFVPNATGRIETNGTLRKLSDAGRSPLATPAMPSAAMPTAPAAQAGVAPVSMERIAAVGRQDGRPALRTPSAGDVARVGGSGGETQTRNVRGGDVKVELNISGGNGGATDIAREAERAVRRVLAQYESDQRGLLSD
ncbi:hypothetical protein PMNALOAF_2770 [Methylobacterium adhaesivum]|uniref:Phage tail tape measure protein n=1 Tax=Methylobacterium adhaesivum TaxID=333297 RepID=A0ABT8BJX5_9HYPH|nr:phage tail tape measure protein [Methylobacterium adhaesivum]MDN3592123.1 phage tail tape measure protein [Methylobacterium adhaesivum]GJD31511.1 hypothetical protein PMNALOAF_2770 [Methylobacterium adhaesivum]